MREAKTGQSVWHHYNLDLILKLWKTIFSRSGSYEIMLQAWNYQYYSINYNFASLSLFERLPIFTVLNKWNLSEAGLEAPVPHFPTRCCDTMPASLRSHCSDLCYFVILPPNTFPSRPWMSHNKYCSTFSVTWKRRNTAISMQYCPSSWGGLKSQTSFCIL